jgi:hypothetical protein
MEQAKECIDIMNSMEFSQPSSMRYSFVKPEEQRHNASEMFQSHLANAGDQSQKTLLHQEDSSTNARNIERHLLSSYAQTKQEEFPLLSFSATKKGSLIALNNQEKGLHSEDFFAQIGRFCSTSCCWSYLSSLELNRALVVFYLEPPRQISIPHPNPSLQIEWASVVKNTKNNPERKEQLVGQC